MNALAQPFLNLLASHSKYTIRLAQTRSEIETALRLRFEVFNLELNEGLKSAFARGMDEDAFDSVCDHLVAIDSRSNSIVGTYRMQLGAKAKHHLGYYSEREFNFAPFEPIRNELVELGRACVHKDHRTLSVISLLWKGIIQYAAAHQARYLIGCSSLTSQDPIYGWTIYHQLTQHLVAPPLQTTPLQEFVLPSVPSLLPSQPALPKLLAAYLSVGARICGPPAIDREFGTIDFLTFHDILEMKPQSRKRFSIH